MSVGDAQEPRAASAGPTHDVSWTAHSQSEICGLARRRGEVEGMGVPTGHRRVLRRSGVLRRITHATTGYSRRDTSCSRYIPTCHAHTTPLPFGI